MEGKQDDIEMLRLGKIEVLRLGERERENETLSDV